MSGTLEEQTKRLEEKHSSFRGSARIQLKHLQFEEKIEQRRSGDDFHLDTKNVDRLTHIFEIEGCLRLDVDNYVPAIIGEETLQDSIRTSGLKDGSELLDRRVPPKLRLPPALKLQCLHGRHRIAAANEFLLPGDKWWVVDLYSDREELLFSRWPCI